MKNILSLLVVVLLLTAPLFADGGGPVRPVTDAEKSYSLKMSGALGKLLPKPLEGWTDGGPVDSDRVANTIEVGAEKRLFTVSMSQDYRRVVDPAVEEAQYKKTMELMEGDPSGQTMKELNKKMEGLSLEVGKAIQSQDQKAMERINKDMEAIQKEYEVVKKAQDSVMQTNLAAITQNRSASVRFNVNSTYESVYNAEPYPGLPQNVIALWKPPSKDSNNDTSAGDLVLAFGAYTARQEDSSTYLELPAPTEADHLKTRGIVVRVSGTRETVDKLVKSLDIPAIQALTE